MAGLAERLYWTAFTAWHVHGQSRFPYLAPEHHLRVQRRRLRRIVAHAYATVPFYRHAMDQLGLRPTDFRTAEDLARLPLISGRDLAAHPRRFRSTRFRPDDVVVTTSSGSTGHRKPVSYDHRTIVLGFAEAQRRRDVMAALLGMSHHARTLEFRIVGCAMDKMTNFARDYTVAPRRLRALRLGVSPEVTPAEAARLINVFKPDLVHGYAAFVGTFFREAITRNLLTHRPRVVFHHSEKMPEADQALIERELGASLVSSYAAAEALFIAWQCEARRGFHIDVDRVAVRVVDQEGRTLPPGSRGDIVVSNLTNRATVLLNYRLGDVVTLSEAPCSCGRTLPTLDSIDGRTDDVILLPDGTWVHARAICAGLMSVDGLVQVQLHQQDLGRFLIRAVPTLRADRDRLKAKLAETLHGFVGVDAAVVVELVETINPEASGKVRVIVRAPGLSRPA